MTNAKRHLIYTYFLQECCVLTEQDRMSVEKIWGEAEEVDTLLIRSIPSQIAQMIVLPELAKTFDYDLHGVPGFWFDWKRELRNSWRLNLNQHGLFRPYRDERNRIIGIYVYRSTWDVNPRLLSSQNLTLGTPAIQPREIYA